MQTLRDLEDAHADRQSGVHHRGHLVFQVLPAVPRATGVWVRGGAVGKRVTTA